MNSALFYIIAFLSLITGVVLTDRRWYARSQHPHATHSKGMLLIGVTGGMGIATILSILIPMGV